MSDPEASELARLRESMRDVVTLLALPAIWSGRAPAAILANAVESLAPLMRLDAIYARLTPQQGHAEEAASLLGTAVSDENVLTSMREEMAALLRQAPGIGFCDLPGSGSTRFLRVELGFYGGTGSIAFGARRPGFPDPAEVILLHTAANLLATAVQSARLVNEAQAARVRASFLAEVSEALASSSQEPDELIGTAARIAVRRVAETCIVDIWRASTESIATVAVAHRDTLLASEALPGQASPALRATVGLVIRGGGAKLHWATDDPAAATDAAVAPIMAAGVVVGAVSLFLDRSQPRYEAADLEMAEVFGRRLGGALEVSRLAQEARDADLRKDEFLAMLGHELRNPLAPILTAVQLLRLRGTDGDREKQIIERQVRHMVRLVDDLLDISRITRGKVELRAESLQIADVIAKAVEIAQPLIDQNSHHLTVSVDPPTARVVGDAVRLAQIFANLLTNAAKYSHPGARISVVASCVNQVLQVSIRDTGIGISAELLPKVFDLFVQGERGLDRAQGGLGIGLALVRSLVEGHGGTVTVHSDGPGQGSEFIVRLPAAQAPEPSVALLPIKVEHSVSRLLVVDDNVDAAELLAEMLQSWGHQVAIAHDGPQALLIAAGFQPSTALVDIGLPLMDGYELAQRLRLVPGLARLRLVALSGYGQGSDKARSSAAGFDVHLVKPADMDSILAAVAVSARESL